MIHTVADWMVGLLSFDVKSKQQLFMIYETTSKHAVCPSAKTPDSAVKPLDFITCH